MMICKVAYQFGMTLPLNDNPTVAHTAFEYDDPACGAATISAKLALRNQVGTLRLVAPSSDV
jgi:hypothetical protein